MTATTTRLPACPCGAVLFPAGQGNFAICPVAAQIEPGLCPEGKLVGLAPVEKRRLAAFWWGRQWPEATQTGPDAFIISGQPGMWRMAIAKPIRNGSRPTETNGRVIGFVLFTRRAYFFERAS